MEDSMYLLSNNKRTLNPRENKVINTNLQRVIPKTPLLFQTNKTKLIHTLADPFKKTIFYAVIIISLFSLFVLNDLILFKNIYILFIIVILLYIYIAQSNNNQDVLHILKYLPENTNLYQYNKIVAPRQNNLQIVLYTVILLFVIRTVFENLFKELIASFNKKYKII